MAAIEPKRVFEIVEPFACRLVAAVGKPAIGLKKHGRPEEAICRSTSGSGILTCSKSRGCTRSCRRFCFGPQATEAAPSRARASSSEAKVRSGCTVHKDV